LFKIKSVIQTLQNQRKLRAWKLYPDACKSMTNAKHSYHLMKREMGSSGKRMIAE